MPTQNCCEKASMFDSNSVLNIVAEELVCQSRLSRFRGLTGDADLIGRGRNPLCGDEIQLGLVLEGELVKQVRFDGRGCMVSLGATSMICEHVEGMKVEEVIGASAETLLGFDPNLLTMNRQRCARLACEILRKLLVENPNEKRPSATNSIDCGGEG